MSKTASHIVPIRPLKEGEHIGIIALSASAEAQRFERGLAYLKSKKFEVKVALNPTEAYGKTTFGFSSDTPERRARALEDLFKDPKVRAIIAARGAYGSMEVLHHLNYELIAKHPKPIVGFSDTTAILVALYQRAGIPAIHGPSVESSFSKAQDDREAQESADSLIAYLTGKSLDPFKGQPLKHLMGAKSAEGRLIGGNLSMLVSLLGTPYAPHLTGHILCLEESNEKPYRIHRMLLQLKLSGLLDGLQGVLLGDFKNCEHDKKLGPSATDVFESIFRDYKFPVLAQASFGHATRNFPLPFGVIAKVSNNQLELKESAGTIGAD